MAKKEIKTDGWINTYADMVTLLLTFFVLLYSMSSLEKEKAAQVASAMQSAFGGSSGSDSILEYNLDTGNAPIVGKEEVTSEDTLSDENLALLKDIKTYIKENNLEDDVTIYGDQRGINIQLKDSVLFDTGQWSLKNESKAVLDEVTGVLSKVDNDIIIEGHSDNVPINNSSMPNNFHLSSARALSVLDYFLDTNKELNPQKLSAQGYGEYRPIAPNDTEKNRAKNRRVNIIILTDAKEKGNE